MKDFDKLRTMSMQISEAIAEVEFPNDRNSAYYAYRQGVMDCIHATLLSMTLSGTEYQDKLFKELMMKYTGHEY